MDIVYPSHLIAHKNPDEVHLMVQSQSSSNTDCCGIAVDHSQEKATSQILSGSNLLSSCKTAWNGMYLEYHYAPPHETPEHYPLQHVIAIQTEGTVRAERRLNGQFRHEQISAGDVCIVPAHTRHWIYSGGEQGLILLSLDPAFLARVAPETIKSDQIELVPQFAHPEPLLYQLGLSLKKAVQADAVDSQFYAQSLGVALTAHLLQHYTQRIEAAKRLLAKHELSVAQVSQQLGFSTQAQFSNFFRKHTGMTSTEYRRAL